MTVFWNIAPKTVFLTILAALLLSLPLSALALPEQELASAFPSQVKPFFEEQFRRDSFQGTGNVTLHYAKREISNPRGALVLVIGRTEFLSKYAELLYDLQDLPFSIYLFDPRGQGASERLLAEHDKGHVDAFNDYVDDLSLFITNVVNVHDGTTTGEARHRQSLPPLFLLAHSMGGTVAALYAERHPDIVQGLILCAPMLAINTAPFPLAVAKLLAHTASILGFGNSYVPKGGPYDPNKPFANNKVTHSKTRFQLNQTLVYSSPSNALGSPTYGWISQAFAGMRQLATSHKHLTMPILLLQASDDSVVSNKPQSDFCTDLPTCTLVTLSGAKHEILMEKDMIRNQAITLIRNFFTQHPQIDRQLKNNKPTFYQGGQP